MTFASFTGSMFVVAHPDYVRSVRLYPRGPEQTELVVDWLLPPATRDSHADRFEHMLGLGRLVIEQDERLVLGLRARSRRRLRRLLPTRSMCAMCCVSGTFCEP